MTRSSSAAVNRRRLRSELRNLRMNLDKTQKEVAEALDWSPVKLMRIEAGQVGITTTDLRALLDQYQVSDVERINELVELAKEGRRSALGSLYGDALSQKFKEFLAYEQEARVIRQYETKLIPGPLQIEDYARSILRTFATPGDSPEKIEQRVKARTARQDLLTQPGGPDCHFIFDESALLRHIGAESKDDGVMLRQLERLRQLNTRPNITIQVVPFSVGAYRALRGPFVILEMSDGHLLYRENPDNQVVIRDSLEDTGPYLEMFEELREIATPPDGLDSVLDGAIERRR